MTGDRIETAVRAIYDVRRAHRGLPVMSGRRWDDEPVDYWPAEREDGYRSARGLGLGLLLAAALTVVVVVAVVRLVTAHLGEAGGAWLGLGAFWVAVMVVLAIGSRGGERS